MVVASHLGRSPQRRRRSSLGTSSLGHRSYASSACSESDVERDEGGGHAPHGSVGSVGRGGGGGGGGGARTPSSPRRPGRRSPSPGPARTDPGGVGSSPASANNPWFSGSHGIIARPSPLNKQSTGGGGGGALGAFYTLVPIRPRLRGGRRSLRTLSPGASLRPSPLPFNTRPRRLSTPTDAFQLQPDFRLYRAGGCARR